MKELAIKFKEAREKQGISQRALSSLTGVMQCTISRYENGVQSISFETALRLAKKLNDKQLIEAIQNNVISKFKE